MVPLAVTVRPVNDPPAAAPVPPAILGAAAESWRLDLNTVFTDPDPGEVLTFTVEENTNPLLFSSISAGPGGLLDASIAPYRWGTARLRVKATGTDGLSSETWLDITVPEPPAPSFTTETAARVNRQTGLLELTVTVKNTGPRALGGFELLVSGLPAGVEVYNASRKVEASWIVRSETVILPGAENSLVLEFYSPTRATAGLQPVITTRPIMPEGGIRAAGPAFAIDRISRLTDGLLVEFSAIPGTLYEMQWSDDGTAWKSSLSPLRAAGTRVQWIDRGPPRTATPPLATPSRFYRVKQL